jgi:hypothetical protein
MSLPRERSFEQIAWGLYERLFDTMEMPGSV